MCLIRPISQLQQPYDCCHCQYTVNTVYKKSVDDTQRQDHCVTPFLCLYSLCCNGGIVFLLCPFTVLSRAIGISFTMKIIRWHVAISCQPDGRPPQPVRPWKSGRVHLSEGSNVVVLELPYSTEFGQESRKFASGVRKYGKFDDGRWQTRRAAGIISR